MSKAAFPIEVRRQQQTAKARSAYPPQAQRRVNGGRVWAERFRAMGPAERARIIAKCVLGRMRQHARKNGYPMPVAYTYVPVVDDNGDIAAAPGSLRPMTDAEIEAL